MKSQARRCQADCRISRLVAGALLLAVAAAGGCVVRGRRVATQGSVGMEYDMDRPGSDFTNFDLASASPELCRDACASDASCQAYTYVKPGQLGLRARCSLKNTVPSSVPSGCCVSGVKGYASAPPPPASAFPPAIPAPAPAPPPLQPVVYAPLPAPPAQSAGMPPMRGLPPPRSMPPIYQPPPATPGVSLEHDIDRPGSDFQSVELSQADPLVCQRACAENPACQAFTFLRPGPQGPRPRCSLKTAVPPAVRNPCCVSGVKNPGAVLPPPSPPPGQGPHHGDRGQAHGGEHDGDHNGDHNGDREGDRHDESNRRGGHDHRNDRDEGPDGQHERQHERMDARSEKRQLEQNVDRPGSDFQNFALPAADPSLCERACRDSGACRAFTYVRPGGQGPNARCSLKNSVPQAVQNGCCISGVR